MKKTEEPIAIVAAACRLPHGPNVSSFWSMVRQGGIGIGKIPESRFDRKLFFDPEPGTLNKTYTDLAALVEYPAVDRSVVPLPPNAENEYDVAHLAFADSVACVCREAGIDPFHFPIRNTGVFVGHTRPGTVSQEWAYRMTLPEVSDYLRDIPAFRESVSDPEKFLRDFRQSLLKDSIPVPSGPRPLYLSSDITKLVSQMLKIDGPGMVFNSACASSLHAIAQAALALRHGRIDAALAGGSTFFHSDTLLLFASSRSMTKNRSCPFDRDADGLVIGEGNVVFLLKRLSDALAANNPVMAVLTGVGIASDGKGKSLWAPRKEGQIEAIQRAYSEDVKMSEIDYIEAHATSTALGDATELEALYSAMGDELKGRSIPLGSAKGNVGHTLEVAGATGVLKAALTLSTGIVPPVGGLRNLNPKIPWDSIPFFAPMKEQPLAPAEGNRPRRAAVNSFGIGGLNVHLVLDEFVPDYWRKKIAGSSLFPASVAPKHNDLNAIVSHRRKREPIAVVGRGCILPDAYSIAEYDHFLASGKNAFRPVPESVWNHDVFRQNHSDRDYTDEPPFVAGVIDHYHYDWKKNKVPPKQVENASPIQFMMLDAVNEAFADYGCQDKAIRKRTGVVVGTEFGGDFSNKMNAVLALPRMLEKLETLLLKEGIAQDRIETILKAYSKTVHQRMPALLDETGSFTPSALASRITKTLDLSGGAVATESGGGSFGAALMCCIDQLESNNNDLMVAIGGQQDLGPAAFDVLIGSRLLSRRPFLSPLDRDADGFVPGEGCGVLLLKRLSDAQRDKDRIYAVISDVGGASGLSTYVNLKKAAARSGAERMADIVELPLTADENDAGYLDALASFQRRDSSTRRIHIGTLASRIGQFGAGSGAAACLKAILEMEKRSVYPEVELKNLSPFAKRESDYFAFDDQKRDRLTEVDVVTGSSNLYFVRMTISQK